MTTEIIGEGFDQNKHKNFRILTSAPIIITAFIVSHFIYNLFCVFIGKYFGFNYIFYYWGAKYTSRPSLPIERFLLYYGICIVFPLLFSFIALRAYLFLKKVKGLVKLLFFWISVFNVCIVFSEIFTLPFLNENNIGQFLSYADLQIYVVTIIFLLCIGAFWLSGLFFVKYLLYSSNTTFYIRYRQRRRKYVVQTALYPWAIAFVILLLFYYPNVTMDIFYYLLTSGIFIGIMWFYCYHRRNRNIRLYKHELGKKLSPVLWTLIFFLYIIFHFVISSGVHVL